MWPRHKMLWTKASAKWLEAFSITWCQIWLVVTGYLNVAADDCEGRQQIEHAPLNFYTFNDWKVSSLVWNILTSAPACSIVYKAFLAQLASCSKQPNYWVKPWLSLPRVLHCILHPSQAPESFLSALHQCHLHLPLHPGLGCLSTAI